MRNTLQAAVSGGNYTSTTNGTSDVACNNGGLVSSTPCSGVGNTITWIPSIQTAMAAVGLSSSLTTCPATPTGNEVVPLYISANSICTGNQTRSSTLINGSTCSGSAFTCSDRVRQLERPLDGRHVGTGGFYAFIVDPDKTVGAVGSAE